MKDEVWIKEQRVCELTGMALSTLRNKRHLGMGVPYYKLGGSVRYKLADVIAYIESCRVVPHAGHVVRIHNSEERE